MASQFDEAYRLHTIHRRNRLDHGLRYPIIDGKRHNRVATLVRSPAIHTGDIDIGITKQRSDRADDTGTIPMPGDQMHPLRLEVHRVTIDPNDTGIVWAVDCSLDQAVTPRERL